MVQHGMEASQRTPPHQVSRGKQRLHGRVTEHQTISQVHYISSPNSFSSSNVFDVVSICISIEQPFHIALISYVYASNRVYRSLISLRSSAEALVDGGWVVEFSALRARLVPQLDGLQILSRPLAGQLPPLLLREAVSVAPGIHRQVDCLGVLLVALLPRAREPPPDEGKHHGADGAQHGARHDDIEVGHAEDMCVVGVVGSNVDFPMFSSASMSDSPASRTSFFWAGWRLVVQIPSTSRV